MSDAIPSSPFVSADAWRGETVRLETARLNEPWWDSWEEVELDELDRALACSGSEGLPASRAEFPLPAVLQKIDRWMTEISCGRGFVLVRGLPVERYTANECERIYWGLGLYLGEAVSQNTDGDLLGHVRDTGEDPAARGIRLYRTRAEQDFHTDGADVIGLLCLKGAKSGGISRIVSSVSVFNEFMRRAPELVPTLFKPFPFDRQGQERPGEPGWFEFPICRLSHGRLGTFFIPWYIRESQALTDAPRLTDEQNQCLELIETIANEGSLYLDMEFEPGDIQLLKNSGILHKRTAFEDWPDPLEKRHLLRLWLSAARFEASSDLLKQGVRAD